SRPSVILLVSGSKLASKSSFFISNLGHRGSPNEKGDCGGAEWAIPVHSRRGTRDPPGSPMVTQERHGSCHLQIQQGCEFYAGSTPGEEIADEELGGNRNVPTFEGNTPIVPDSNRFLRGSVGIRRIFTALLSKLALALVPQTKKRVM